MNVKQKLIDKFGKQINYMSCVYLNDGENVLRHFLDVVKPKSAIEIGVFNGVSTSIIAEYAKKVYAFDIEDQPLRKKIWSYLEICNIDYTIVKDREDEIEKVNNVFDKINIDFCFLDGEHFHGELEKDFNMCDKCDNILIHDYSKDFGEIFDFCNNKRDSGEWMFTGMGSFCLLQRMKSNGNKRKNRKSRR